MSDLTDWLKKEAESSVHRGFDKAGEKLLELAQLLDDKDNQIIQLEAQLKECNKQNAKLFMLARKTLWLANCWNDHNFGHPQDEVKELVTEMGLDTIDKANKFLMECEPKENN